MALSRQEKGHRAYTVGKLAEFLGFFLLRLKGYKILAHRLQTPVGEIDLLAQKNETIVLVEVKFRQKEQELFSAISPHQKKRLIRAAKYCQSRYNFSDKITVRFDAILCSKWSFPLHLENIWGNDE